MPTVGEVINSVVLKGLFAVFEWMKDIFTVFDAWTWILGAFGVYTVYRFLLSPLLGGRQIPRDSDAGRETKTRQKTKNNGKIEESNG